MSEERLKGEIQNVDDILKEIAFNELNRMRTMTGDLTDLFVILKSNIQAELANFSTVDNATLYKTINAYLKTLQLSGSILTDKQMDLLGLIRDNEDQNQNAFADTDEIEQKQLENIGPKGRARLIKLVQALTTDEGISDEQG